MLTSLNKKQVPGPAPVSAPEYVNAVQYLAPPSVLLWSHALKQSLKLDEAGTDTYGVPSTVLLQPRM
jgi:hypothetical protein